MFVITRNVNIAYGRKWKGCTHITIFTSIAFKAGKSGKRKHIMTLSIVSRYCLMFLISICYFLLRLPAKICPLTRKNKLVIAILTLPKNHVKFVRNTYKSIFKFDFTIAVTIYRPKPQANKLKLTLANSSLLSDFCHYNVMFVRLLSLKGEKWQNSDKNCKLVTMTSFTRYAIASHGGWNIFHI